MSLVPKSSDASFGEIDAAANALGGPVYCPDQAWPITRTLASGDPITLRQLIDAHVSLTIQRVGRIKEAANVLDISIWELRTLRRKAALAIRAKGRAGDKGSEAGVTMQKDATA